MYRYFQIQSGYVRMKNSNSDNFKKLKDAAKEKGYEI